MHLRIFLMASFLLSASSFLASIPPETIFINIRGEQIVEGGDNINLGERTIGIYPDMTYQSLKDTLQIALELEPVRIVYLDNLLAYKALNGDILFQSIGLYEFGDLHRSSPVVIFR
jgi:hypothetical protein